MARTLERRHREAVARIREWLRKTYNGSAQPHLVTIREVSELLSMYPGTVGPVLQHIASLAGSGLTSIKMGTYEYIWTEDGLANPQPAEPARRRNTDRRLQIYDFMQENKGVVWSVTRVAQRTQSPESSVSGVLRKLAAIDSKLVPVECVGSGLYIWPRDDVPVPEVLRGTLNGVEPEPEPEPEPVPEPEPEPEPERCEHGLLRSEPEPVPEPAPSELPRIEVVVQTDAGEWIARDGEGHAYKVVQVR